MNLIVDIGNSSTKLALLDRGEIILQSRFEAVSDQTMVEFLSGKKIDKTIISSVKDIPDFMMDIIESTKGSVHILSHLSNLPIKISYRTPETLGSDRIAAVAGAYNAFNGADSLIIDAGTAITYDFLEGLTFSGGNISPGIETRFRALHQFTGRLPLVSGFEDYTFPGITTQDAIIAGVISGVVFEINEYIRTFEEKHNNSNIILTGGDAGFLKDRLAGRVNFLPDIVINGLNYILEYNAK